MEQEPLSLPPKIKQHKLHLSIFFIIIILILVVISSYLGFVIWQIKTKINNTNIEAIPTKIENNWSIDTQSAQSIQAITNDLISGKLQLTATDNQIPTYINEFDLSQDNGWSNYMIKVFKYSPGAIIDEGYEGFAWTRNLDNEVKETKKLTSYKNGTYITQTQSDDSTQTYSNKTIKSIGNQKYIITDSFFQPSRSWHRKYQTFDEKTNNIIEVTIGIKPNNTVIQQKTIYFEDKCALFYLYPEEVNNYFLELETLMEN